MDGPTTPTRPLAFAPPPLTDEPLDGYFEHLAHRLSLPVNVLHSHLGLRPSTPLGLARHLDSDRAQVLATSLGWTENQLHSMTLRRYADRGLLPPPGTQGGGPGSWLRRRGVRFCPACLRERDLRWRLSWYLQWTAVCVDHNVLLDVACPACGRPPRTLRKGHRITGTSPRLFQDATDRDPDGTTAECSCAVSLLATADHVRIPSQMSLDEQVPACLTQAQRLITRNVDGTEGRIGLSRSPTEWVHDLAALCRLLAVSIPPHQIPKAYVEILSGFGTSTSRDDLTRTFLSWEPHLGLNPYTAPAARFSEVGASRAAFAVIASTAAAILDSPDVSSASQRLASVLPPEARRAAAWASRSRGISWPLARALWLAEHPTRPSQTRAIRLGGDRFRSDGAARIPLDRSRLPARPWNSVRGSMLWTGQSPFAGLTATVALLTVATSTPLRTVCELLDHPHLSTRVAHETRKFFGHLAGSTATDVFDELLRVHDAITTGEIPIDYERRRRAFPAPTALARRTASRLARELGHRPTPRLARFMSWWIYEQLTGNDILLQPDLLELPGAIRSLYTRQRATWDSKPPPGLLRRAEHALLVNCIDEPIVWAPTPRADGSWSCDSSSEPRQLDWSRRPRRRTSRRPSRDDAIHSLEEMVALAGSGQSPESDRLAMLFARFTEVVHHGTITAAARSIGISQPTLSVAMRTLERETATALFDRSHHAVTLTERGRGLRLLLQQRPIDPSFASPVGPPVALRGHVALQAGRDLNDRFNRSSR